MKKIIDLHQVDAFTDTLFGGNPGGVVTNADELNTMEMTNIAREMNLSETAFVLKPTVADADIKLRYFTPTDEVQFCGHATVGALYELARLCMYGLGGSEQSTIRVETNVGVLFMSVRQDKDSQPRITFSAPKTTMKPYRLQGKPFADSFGIPIDVIKESSQILIDGELNYVYIPVKSLKQLGDLTFNYDQIHANFSSENIVVFSLFTNETIKKESHLHTRGLAPLIGIEEDPFTGSMQAGLIHAVKQNLFIGSKLEKIIVEQGDFIDRPGFAEIHHDISSGELLVTASAVQVFSTKLEV